MPFLQGAALQAQGKLGEAARAYAKDAERLPDSPTALYRDLLQFVGQELAKIEASPASVTAATAAARGRPPLLISVPVWGRSYIGSLDSLMLRTLLAPGNLPAVAG